jgi:hypothetical protein
VALEQQRVGAGGAACRALDQRRPDEQVHRHVLAGVHALAQVARPALEAVHPGLQGVAIAADLGHAEGAAPAVVDQRRHRHLGPVGVCLAPVEEHRRQRVVAVGEDVSLDHHRLAHRPLDREPAGVYLRLHALDNDPPRTVVHALLYPRTQPRPAGRDWDDRALKARQPGRCTNRSSSVRCRLMSELHPTVTSLRYVTARSAATSEFATRGLTSAGS